MYHCWTGANKCYISSAFLQFNKSVFFHSWTRMKDADGGWRVRSHQGFFYSFLLPICIVKVLFISYKSSWLFPFFKLFFKGGQMNNVLCLKFLYQNARWNSPESRRFDLRIQNLPGEDPGPPPLLSTLCNV